MSNRRTLLGAALTASISVVLAACSSDSAGLPSQPSLSGITTSAATVRVSCVKRGTRRSSISVDGNNLAPGTYRARVTSPLGTHRVVSAPRTAVGDEVSFDFDSNPADIAAGATPIAPNYITIVSGAADVRGQILNSAGTVVASAAVNCTVR